MRVRLLSALAFASLASAPALGAGLGETGFYAGAQLGWSDINMDWQLIESNTRTLEEDGAGLEGAGGGLVLGYQVRSGNVIGAIELNANSGGPDYELNLIDRSVNIELEKQESYGASVLVGRMIADSVLVFGQLGLQQSTFEATANGASDDDEFSGPRFGGGVAWQAGQNLAIRIDYTRTTYGEEDYGSPDTTAASFKPDEDLFQAGVFVYF